MSLINSTSANIYDYPNIGTINSNAEPDRAKYKSHGPIKEVESFILDYFVEVPSVNVLRIESKPEDELNTLNYSFVASDYFISEANTVNSVPEPSLLILLFLSSLLILNKWYHSPLLTGACRR